MEVEILNKINTNIALLTDEDYKIISANNDLKERLINQIANGSDFNINAFINYFSEEILNPKISIIILNALKEKNPEEFINIIITDFESPEVIEEFGSNEAISILSNYQHNNLEEIIKLIIENSNNLYNEITNPVIINRLISLKKYDLAYLFKPTNLTNNIEDFIIESLNHNIPDYLSTLSDNIFNACLKKNHLELILRKIKTTDEKYISIIKDSLKNGILNISSLDRINYTILPTFLEDKEINFSYLKNKIINKERLTNSDIEEINANEKLLTILLDTIEKSYISGEKYHSYYYIEHPKVKALAFKYDFDFLTKVLKEENILDQYKNIDNLIENIKFNINNNLNNLLSLANTINFDAIPESISLIILSSLHINDLISLLSDYRLTEKSHNNLVSLINKALTANPKTLTSLPENFSFEKNLPSAIIRTIIPILDSDTLSPNNIHLTDYINDIDILELIFIRLKELRSNKFNNNLYEIQNVDSPLISSIIFDKENPLNLNISQTSNFSGKIKTDNLDYIDTILKNSKTISIQDIYTLVNQLEKTGNNKYFNFIKRALPLVSDKQALFQHISNFLKKQNSSSNNNEEINKELLLIYEEFIKTQTAVPLSVTQYLSAKIIMQNSLECLEGPITDIKYFDFDDKTNLDIVGSYLIKSLDEGKIVNIEILYNIENKGFRFDSKYYDYPNISLDSTAITFIISHLISTLKVSKAISRFLKTANINNILKISPNLFVPNYTEELISRLKFSIQNEQFTLNSSTLSLLDNTDVSNNLKNELIMIFNISANTNHIDYSIPSEPSLYISNNEYIIKFIKSAIEKNCSSIREISTNQKNIFSNQIYIDYFIELIEQKKLNLDYSFINNISLESPSFKSELIKLINENRVSFENNIYISNSYYDNDIYQAIMSNPNVNISIKKTIITQMIHELAEENNNTINNLSDTNIQLTIETICKIYNIKNKDNLKKVIKEYGLKTIVLIDNNDFIDLLNSNELTITRFFEIFKNREISISTVEGIIDSLKQNLFAKDNQEIIDFYTNSIATIQRGITITEESEIINTLINYIPANLDDIILKTKDEQLLSFYHSDFNLFMKYLIENLAINQNKYENVYHEITNNYIHQKRNEYREKNDIYNDSKVISRYEEKSLLNAIINYYLDIFNQVPKLMTKLFDKNELNIQTIYFLTHPEQANKKYSKEEIISIKKNIKNVKSILEDYIKEKYDLDTFVGYLDNQDNKDHKDLVTLINNPHFKPYLSKVKLIPVVPKNEQNLQELTKDLDYKLLRETILIDDEKYKCLINLLNKYSFLNWKDLFAPTINRLTIGEDGSEMINFINAFNKIYEYEHSVAVQNRTIYINKETEKMRKQGIDEDTINNFIKNTNNQELKLNITPYKIFNYCVIYSSVANCYKVILGLEDFEHIKNNKGPNASHETRQKRLDETAKLQIEMMKLKEVSIPSFIHEYNFSDNRRLNIIVGNKSDSRNLTHGERTGACMRSFGHAHDLFKFCATDKRGFHFTIIDPDTNEYISRVSGFRNGNTIFLNQLRESLNQNKYSNEDLIEACKSVAKRIIEETHKDDKNSPIENVVVSTGFAVSAHYEETQELSEQDIGRGVYEGYKDVTNNAYILATSNEKGIPVVLKLSPLQPSYKPVRLPIKTYKENEIDTKVKILMQRINALKQCLQNPNPDFYNSIDIDLEQLEHHYLYVIIGEDWYVALNSNLEIEKEQIEIDERSYDEIKQAIEQIEQIKQTIGGNNYAK